MEFQINIRETSSNFSDWRKKTRVLIIIETQGCPPYPLNLGAKMAYLCLKIDLLYQLCVFKLQHIVGGGFFHAFQQLGLEVS